MRNNHREQPDPKLRAEIDRATRLTSKVFGDTAREQLGRIAPLELNVPDVPDVAMLDYPDALRLLVDAARWMEMEQAKRDLKAMRLRGFITEEEERESLDNYFDPDDFEANPQPFDDIEGR